MLMYAADHGGGEARMRVAHGSSRYRQSHRGFTLVELLVVIGIIALLIAILLPALNRARQISLRTQCAAKLQQIMVAANVHRADHADYYPLAGILTGGQPDELDDSNCQKYDYRDTDPNSGYNAPSWVTRAMAPITVSLGSEMGFKRNLYFTHAQTFSNTLDNAGLTRCFQCPAADLDVQGFYSGTDTTQFIHILNWPGSDTDGQYSYAVNTLSSYVFNEVVLGFNDQYGRLRGHASQVKQSARTMFAADGIGDDGYTEFRLNENPFFGFGMLTLYNNFPGPNGNLPGSAAITLADIINQKQVSGNPVAGNPQCFDAKRHQKMINIAFCDGHVETRTINANDLQKVFLFPP
jgi:prepilin-type N-terminal cleavage/methylation domain-containing protein/prepilin-type processing-associated H-X9-DG protein